MRRAVRDYKYEVNEGRMTDECIQYLTQLQKDWERHRVKLGVEALRKEVRRNIPFPDFLSSLTLLTLSKWVYQTTNEIEIVAFHRQAVAILSLLRTQARYPEIAP